MFVILQLSSRVSAILLTAVVALPWLLIPCVVLFILFVGVRWYYLKAARDLKRLEGVGKITQPCAETPH